VVHFRRLRPLIPRPPDHVDTSFRKRELAVVGIRSPSFCRRIHARVVDDVEFQLHLAPRNLSPLWGNGSYPAGMVFIWMC
jgi:hypothetical protein